MHVLELVVRNSRRLPLLLLLAVLPAAAVAQQTAPENTLPSKGIGIDGFDSVFTESHVFTNAHPDLRYRKRGQEALRRNDLANAVLEFEKAALNADKISQSILAEMHWQGRGVPANRVLGYIWADLAAERLTPALVAKRENYWLSMSGDEREQALSLGESYYDRYGDAVAQPRQARGMKLALSTSLNRRWVKHGKVCLSGDISPFPEPRKPQAERINCSYAVSSDKFHDPKYWEPKQYWAWQEKVMEASFNPHIFPLPEVEVGPIDTTVR